MNGREHSIDRVAHAMTSGAPSETFTARVMAPVYGQPQPGFTGRVMARIDATPRRSAVVTRALAPALAAAGVLAVVAAVLLPGDAPLPSAVAPALVDARVGEPGFAMPGTANARTTPRRRSAPAAAGRRVGPSVMSAPADRPAFETEAIDALSGPTPIVVPPLTPMAPPVPSLALPAPLSISPLRIEKEPS